jgi:quercetin dioxygenase-like cupin family protein
MIKAYKLYTGSDGHSHITPGFVAEGFLTEAVSISFKETAPHSFYDWHPAPATQYVICLIGTLRFETWLGETFVFKPGDVLIAMDTTGTGHKWQLIDNEPWKRAYIVFGNNATINFSEDKQD